MPPKHQQRFLLGGLLLILLLWLVTGLALRMAPLLIWAVSAAVLVLSLIMLGLGVDANPRWYGILIEKDRNRVSLSRLQITLWTIVILSAYLTVALVRSTPQALRPPPPGCQEFGPDGCLPQPLNIDFPNEVWMALGISTLSFASSSLIKTNKRKQYHLELKRHEQASPALYKAPEARLSDLFYGDDEGNKDSIDFSKVQMFFFTMVLIAVYVFAIATLLADAETLLAAHGFQFPDFSASMTIILGISHAGYLLTKAPSQTA